MYLLSEVLEEPACAEQWEEHYGALLQLFGKNMQDDNIESAAYTVAALQEIVSYLGPEHCDAFRALVPASITVIRRALEESEMLACDSMDFFELTAEAELSFIKPFLPNIVEFCLEVGLNTDYEGYTRVKAWSFVHWLSLHNPKYLVKKGIFPHILQGIFTILSTETPEVDEEEDADDNALVSFVPDILEILAENVPAEVLFPPVSEFVLTASQSESIACRKAGFRAICAVAQGCSYFIRESGSLDGLLAVIFEGMAHPENGVRKSACIALADISQYCDPDINERHAEVLPRILQSLQDSSTEVRERSCYALEQFVEHMSEEIAGYLDALITALTPLIEMGHDLHQVAISCIGAAALAAKDQFTPYFDQVITHLKMLVTQREEDHIPLVCQAIDTLGILIVNSARDTVVPHVQECMQLVLQALQELEGDTDVRVAAFSMFGSVVCLLRGDFAPYLDHVLPLVHESCVASNAAEALSAAHDGEGEGEWEDEDEEDRALDAVNTADMPETKAAFELLGALAEFMGAGFMAFMDKSLELCNQLQQRHEQWRVPQLRMAALKTYTQLAICIFVSGTSADGNPVAWTKGLPLRDSVPPALLSSMSFIMRTVVANLASEAEAVIVCDTFENIGTLFKVVGPSAVADEEVVHALAAVAQQVLVGEALCQQEMGDDGEEANEDEDAKKAEYELLLIEYTQDLIVNLAKVLGDSFGPFAQVFLPLLLQAMGNPHSTVSERSSAVGSLAEIIEAMEGGVSDFQEPLYAAIMEAIDDPEPEVRGNAVFAAGMLCQCAGAALVPCYTEILRKLYTNCLHVSGEEWNRVVDNACGAVARMILQNPEAVPIASILPNLVALLPPKEDFAETVTVFKAFLTVLAFKPALIADSLVGILNAVASLASMNQITDENRDTVLEFLRQSSQGLGDVFPAAVGQLAEEAQQIIHSFFS